MSMQSPYRLMNRSDYISTEQINSFLQASFCVLAIHKHFPKSQVKVKFTKKDLGKCRVGGSDAAGTYNNETNTITLLDVPKDVDDYLTVVLHEVIHSVKKFPIEHIEKCTSTLTAKLKPTVSEIAAILCKGYYSRAAFIAHTQIHYRPKGKDFYDQNQYRNTGTKSRYMVKKIKRKLKQTKKKV